MGKALLLILISFFFSQSFFGQSERKDFVIEITFIDWLNQPFVKYTLNKKQVKVETSYYQDFKIIEGVLYKRKISKTTSNTIYKYLSELKIDTAKANCNNPVLDGLYSVYYFEGYGLGQTQITTHACTSTSAAKLHSLVEAQIKKRKYRYFGIKESDPSP
jgi:hypothetical protein